MVSVDVTVICMNSVVLTDSTGAINMIINGELRQKRKELVQDHFKIRFNNRIATFTVNPRSSFNATAQVSNPYRTETKIFACVF